MRVLVTGHRGYLGSIMIPVLRAHGHAVAGLDSDIFRGCTYGDQEVPRLPELTRDVRSVRPSDLEGFEAVIHLAGLSNDPLGNLSPRLTYQINHQATVRLAELARDAGVSRFVFSSSCSNYGASGGAGDLDEDAEFNPVTPYARSKVLAERDLSCLARGDFSPTYLRNATVYGFSPRLRFDLVVNNLTAWAYTTGRVRLKSDGRACRPLVHVQDVALAFAAALATDRDVVHDRAYNIGRSEENYRIRDVAQVVADVAAGSSLEIAPGAGCDSRDYRVCCERARRELVGFEPCWDVEAGVRELLAAFRHGLRVADFEGARLQRIGHLRQLISRGLLDCDLRWRGPAAADVTSAA